MWVFPYYPYSLVAFLIIVPFFILLTFFYKKSSTSSIKKYVLLNFLIIYIVICISAYTYDLYIDYKLGIFDIDGDGFLSPKEATSEAQKYYDLKVNDLGRNLSFVTGFLTAFTHSFIFIFMLLNIRK